MYYVFFSNVNFNAMCYIKDRCRDLCFLLVLTEGAVVVRDAVAPVGVLLHQTEGGVEAGAVLALGDLLLALQAGPGEGTDAVELTQLVNTVTTIQTRL